MSATNTSQTIGSGPDTLALSMSEDAWEADAMFTVFVDGVQIGGVQTTTASHAAGQTQTFNVLGTFGSGKHTVSVDFLNDAYGGTPSTDRNLYVNSATFDGTAIASSALVLDSGGAQSFSFTNTSIASSSAAPIAIGSGPDTLNLLVDEDAWQGDAQFSIVINGVTIGGALTTTASHAAGQTQAVSVSGNWGANPTIGVSFINDAYGGSASTDRNLYVSSASYDGETLSGAPATLLSNGTVNLTVPATSLTINLAEDAWQGDAQYSVTVDGKTLVQDGTVTALHAQGQSQAVTLQDVLSPGTHVVAVTFLNDAYGGSASTDRNLYVTGIAVNGTAVAGTSATLLSDGTQDFNVVVPGNVGTTGGVPAASASPNNTSVLAGSSAAITDAAGNAWTITTGRQVAVNGVTDTTTADVIGLAYEGGLIWQENASLLWWSKASPGAAWGPSAGTATTPIPSSTPASIVLTEPGTETVTAGSSVAISGVAIAETGLAANATTTIVVSAASGSVSMNTATTGSSITLTGTLATLNTDLASLSYTAGKAAGTDALSFLASSGTVSGAGQTAITIGAVATSGTGNDVGGSSGQGGYLLPSGLLSTSGSQIVDSSGNPVRIDSIGWNGTDNTTFAPAGLQWASYQSIIDSIKADGFNTIRIPWSDALLHASPSAGSINYSLNPGLAGQSSMQVLDAVIAYAGQTGLKVILDHHNNEGGPGGGGGDQGNGMWFDSGPGTDGTDGSGNVGTVTSAQSQADWVSIAQRYAGNQTVIGYDLTNEPSGYAGRAVWGGGGTNDILAMYENTGNAIQAVDPGKLIIAEGVYSGNVANLLSQVPAAPVVLNDPNKVVYSVHIYPGQISGTYPDSGAAAVALWNQEFGFLYTGAYKAPVLIGELGASLDGQGPDSTGTNSTTGLSNLTEEQNYASAFTAYLNGKDGALGGPTFTGNQQPVSSSWWLAGSETGQSPDGIQTAWGAGNYRPGQQAVTDQLLYNPTHINAA